MNTKQLTAFLSYVDENFVPAGSGEWYSMHRADYKFDNEQVVDCYLRNLGIDTNCPDQIETVEDCSNLMYFFNDLIGCCFHPDTPIADYVNEQNEPSFTVEQCAYYQERLDAAFLVCANNNEDIYSLAMPELPEDPHDARNLDKY